MAQAMALTPAFGDDAAGRPPRTWQPGGPGGSAPIACGPGKPAAAGAGAVSVSCCGSSSGCASPRLQDRTQVLETLGSLQRALSRNESDSLWRENHLLRGDVAAWKEEAGLRQREISEVRLEAAQLRAELDAERSRSQLLAQQLVTSQQAAASATSAASSSTRLRRFDRVDRSTETSPWRFPLREQEDEWRCRARFGGPSSGGCGGGGPPGASASANGDTWALWDGHAGSATASAATATACSGRPQRPPQAAGARSPSPPSLRTPRGGGPWPTSMPTPRCRHESPAASSSSAPPARPPPPPPPSGGSGLDRLDLSLEARVAARRAADEMAALNARHAAETAELQAKHSRALESMQTEVDVAYARARIAEARCVQLARGVRRTAATNDVLVVGSRRLATLAAAFALWCRGRLEAVAAAHGAGLQEAGRRAGEAEALAYMRLCAAEAALFQVWALRAQRRLWAAWTAAARERQRAREAHGLRNEVLRGRFARHAQLSWLCAQQAADALEVLATMLLARWRALAADAVLAGAQLGLRQGTTRSAALEEGLTNLARAACRHALLGDVLQTWRLESALSRTSGSFERREAATVTHLARAECRAGAFRLRLAAVWGDTLREKAWLAFRVAVREQAQERDLDRVAAETARRLRGDAGRCVRLAVDASLAARGWASAFCAWRAWASAVVTGRLTRAVEGLGGRLDLARGRFRFALLRATAWGARKLELYRALCAWVRRVSSSAGERELATVRGQCRSRHSVVLGLVAGHLSQLQAQEACRWAWRAWCGLRSASRRLEAADAASAQEARCEWALCRARAFALERSARCGFVLRSCLAGWRRLRSSQYLHGLEAQLDELRCAFGGLRYTCWEQAACLGERVRAADGGGIAYVCWTLWRRLRRDRLLLEDLDSLQRLLGCFQAEGSRKLACDSMEAWVAEHEAVLSRETLVSLTVSAEEADFAGTAAAAAAAATAAAAAGVGPQPRPAVGLAPSQHHQTAAAPTDSIPRRFSPPRVLGRTDPAGHRDASVSFAPGGPSATCRSAASGVSAVVMEPPPAREAAEAATPPGPPPQLGQPPAAAALSAAPLRPPPLGTTLGLGHSPGPGRGHSPGPGRVHSPGPGRGHSLGPGRGPSPGPGHYSGGSTAAHAAATAAAAASAAAAAHAAHAAHAGPAWMPWQARAVPTVPSVSAPQQPQPPARTASVGAWPATWPGQSWAPAFLSSSRRQPSPGAGGGCGCGGGCSGGCGSGCGGCCGGGCGGCGGAAAASATAASASLHLPPEPQPQPSRREASPRWPR